MKDNREPIGKIWQKESARVFRLSQVSHAFAVLARAFQRGDAAPRFWFPDYFCNGALTKLRDCGAELNFYPVGLDMKPDWAACREAAEGAPPDFFVLVHYFGACNDIEAARAFCDLTGAKFLEDATQVLRPVGLIGSLGDFICYGPRKFFQIPDGGLLVVRQEVDASRIEETLGALPPSAPSAFRWRSKRVERAIRHKLRRRKQRGKPLRSIHLDEVNPEPQSFAETRMSAHAIARLISAIQGGRIDAITAQRGRYESLIGAFLENRDGVSPVAKSTDALSCWTGLICSNKTVAQKALDDLRANGFPALPWPNQLPPEILLGEKHDRAIRLRGTTLIVSPTGEFRA